MYTGDLPTASLAWILDFFSLASCCIPHITRYRQRERRIQVLTHTPFSTFRRILDITCWVVEEWRRARTWKYYIFRSPGNRTQNQSNLFNKLKNLCVLMNICIALIVISYTKDLRKLWMCRFYNMFIVTPISPIGHSVMWHIL